MVVSGVLGLGGALPAGAHATLDVAVVPTDSSVTLTMDVPHEREDTTYNTQVVTAIPDGWTGQSCTSKPTWTCTLTVQSGHPVVRFTKQPGAPRAEDESFTFTVRSPSTVASFKFPTIQTYSTGEVVSWIGDAGSPTPAPVLATRVGGTPTTAPPTAPPHSSPSPTVPSAGQPNLPSGDGTPAPPAGAPASSAPQSPESGEVTVPQAGPDGSTPGTDPGSEAPPDGTTPSPAGGARADQEAAVGMVSNATPDTTAPDSGSPTGIIAALVLAVAVAGVGALVWRRRTGTSVTASD